MSTSSGGRVVLLLGVAFLLLSGEIANADPVEIFQETRSLDFESVPPSAYAPNQKKEHH